METFTCIECSRELDSVHESLTKDSVCDDCIDESSKDDFSRWCELCDMTSYYSDSTPYGTCGCS